MSRDVDTIKQYVLENSRFLRLADGEVVEATYLYAEKAISSYGEKEKATLHYHFEVEEFEKILDSQSNFLAYQIMELELENGDVVTISRKGTGSDTKYYINKKEN